MACTVAGAGVVAVSVAGGAVADVADVAAAVVPRTWLVKAR